MQMAKGHRRCARQPSGNCPTGGNPSICTLSKTSRTLRGITEPRKNKRRRMTYSCLQSDQVSPHFSAQNVDFAKSNEKFLKIPCFSLRLFFLVQDSQKRLFFPQKRKIGMFFNLTRVSNFHDFPRFFHINPTKTTFFPRSLQKLENPCFFLDSYFKFPRFSIEITEIHVLSTLVKKNLFLRTHCIEYSKNRTNLHITSVWCYE